MDDLILGLIDDAHTIDYRFMMDFWRALEPIPGQTWEGWLETMGSMHQQLTETIEQTKKENKEGLSDG